MSRTYGGKGGIGLRLARVQDGGAGRLRSAAVAVALLSVTFDAAALWDDKIELYAAETVRVEDNVFRISDNVDSGAFLGSSDKGDTITTTSAGINFDIPVSRQRFVARTRWDHVRYDRFSDLDSVDRDARLLWLWQLGNDLNGQLGYTETKALASFTNFQGRVPDPVKTKRPYANATYLLTPSWQLQAGVADQTQRHTHELRQANNIDQLMTDLTASYISTAQNKIGLSVRQEDGHYPQPQSVSGLLFDNDYVQRSVGVVTDWTLTGKSRVIARVDRVRRDYDELNQRNFDGTTFNAAYDWKATSKLALSAVARRDISSTEDIQTSFVLVKGFVLRPTFDLSEKIKLSANVDYSIREYLGDPGLTLGTTTARRDHVRIAAATVSYQPLRMLSLLLSWQHESRSSNSPFIDYDANVVSVTGRLAF